MFAAKKTALIGIIFFLTYYCGFAAGPTPTSTPQVSSGFLYNTIGTNGTIYSIASTSTTAYVGGSFTKIGKRSGRMAIMKYYSPQMVTGYPKVLGDSVNCAASDGAGGWYIGGSFTHVNNEPRQNLAHIFSNGSLDPLWQPSTDAVVRAILFFNSRVYIGGDFSVVNGDFLNPKNHLASVDPVNGGLNAINYGINSGGIVRTIKGLTGNIFVGGDFTSAGGSARNHIAAFNSLGALITAWNPDISGPVYAIAAAEGVSEIYAGGSFSTVNQGTTPVIRNNLAAFSMSGAATSFNPDLNGAVNTLCIAGADLYCGGAFTYAGADYRERAAAFTLGSAGAATAWAPSFDNVVNSIAYASGNFYITGEFTSVNFPDFPFNSPRAYAAAYDASGNINSTWSPNLEASGLVIAADDAGENLLIGGNFNIVNVSMNMQNAAAFDLAAGDMILGWNPRPNNTVYAVSVTNNVVYMGGAFTTVNPGGTRNYAAAFSITSTSTPLGWNPNLNGSVRAICAAGNSIYLGGYFTQLNGGSALRNRGAAVDPGTGIDQGWNPDLNNAVRTISAYNNIIYTGGLFTMANGGTVRNYAAAFDAVSGTVQPGWDPDLNGPVMGIDAGSGNIYLAGSFTTASGGAISRNGAACFSAAGPAMPWNPGLDNSANTVKHENGVVFIGGNFQNVNSLLYNYPYLAVFDSVTGTAFSSWNPFAADYTQAASVMCLAVSGSKVMAGGQFAALKYLPYENAALIECPPQMYTPTPVFTATPVPTPKPALENEPYVFPVPASDRLSIIYPLAAAAAIKISLFDAAGNMAMSQDFSGTASQSNRADMDVSKLKPGPYFYLIKGRTNSGNEVKFKAGKFLISR